MIKTQAIYFLLFLVVPNWCCGQNPKDQKLFSLLNEKQTGISYLNNISEDDSLNVLRYEYLYNGAGVGVADFNNDGWIDIFFSGNTASNKLFLNKEEFSFMDITNAAGVAGNGTWSTGVSIADVNSDGLMDIYVCHSGKYNDSTQLCNELFINLGIKKGIPVFKEMAKEYGLNAPGTQSTQAAFFDYDNDGDLDMFLLNHSNHSYNPLLNTKKIRSTPNFNFGNRLFRNDRNAKGDMTFTDVTISAGIINNALNFGLSVTISDLNNDGWPEIYTTSDYTEKDCLYINNKDGTFTESLSTSMAHIAKFAMGADIADYNNDGRPDIFTLDMLPEDNHRQKLLKGPDEYDQYHLLLDSGYYHQQMRNMLQLNEGVDSKGNLRFSEIGQLAGISNTDWSWSALLADFDNDGWKDLFVTNGYLRDYTDMDFLKYTVANAMVASTKEGHLNFKTVELVKKMPSNKLHNYVFKNNGDLTFTNKSTAWGVDLLGISNAATYADLDNDGDLDLIVCNNNEPALVYKNNATALFKNNFLKLRLTGTGLNTRAYGAKIKLTTDDGKQQYQELFPVRGYQSTVTQEIHFAFPEQQLVKQLDVTWPDGGQTVLNNIASNQLLELMQKDATASQRTADVKKSTLFYDFTDSSGIGFKHRENDFIDFKGEVLLPYQLSRQGPALAKADVNGDGLEDIFIGGAIGQSGELYLQTAMGNFSKLSAPAFFIDRESEDVNAVFFDVDVDGDMDLYVVSGGNEYGDGSPEYADRLYINDGKGNFEKLTTALPDMFSSKEAVAVGDYDNDGYPDLFVGGKSVPGSFPMIAPGYLLRNESKAGVIKLSDVTDQVCPRLRKPGMVTAAVWTDLNSDSYPELMIAGEWMSVMLFQNNQGNLNEISSKAGLATLLGMWTNIVAKDIDDDGDIDFIVGNGGYNNQFKASEKEPVTMYAADFDDDGTIDPMICYYIGGKSYPMASRDELLDQIPSLKKKFVKYKDYADVEIADIFPRKKLQEAAVYQCNNLSSGIFYNNGDLTFTFHALPLKAQFSKVFGIVADDFDNDDINDLLITGNFLACRVQLGQCDASLGTFLKGYKDKIFKAVDPAESGCFADGDIRKMLELTTATGARLLVIAKNNDHIQVLKVK